MISKLIRSLIRTAVFIVLTCFHSFAFELEAQPGAVNPGDVFLLVIKGETSISAEAEFLGSRIKFYPYLESRLIALVPVDISTPPGEYTVSVTQGQETNTRNLIVKEYKFKTIELTLPEGKVTLSPENQKRAAREQESLESIWSMKTSRTWGGAFTSPTGTEISEVFGVKRIMNEKKTSIHKGMDFRGKTGTPVKAINSGTVVLTGDLFYGGNTLMVDHGMGLYSIYMHLSELKASHGDSVSTNQVIGLIGSTGRATGPHLHMSVKLNGVSINPESLQQLGL